MKIEPDTTCALVVGIDTYGLGKDWRLPGARIGAAKFIEWLHLQGVSKTQFKENANVDVVRSTLDALKGFGECHCLIVYWAGHGFETEYEERGLYLSDAVPSAPKAIKVDELISYIRHETPQFTTVIGIFDSCATGVANARVLFEQIPIDRSITAARQDGTFILSASSGQETDYPDDKSPSLFTQGLLQLLDNGFTLYGAIESIKSTYPVIFRDGRSHYWSSSKFNSESRTLTDEVCRIGSMLNLTDAQWRKEATIVEASLHMPNADFRAIVEKIAGWSDRELGAIMSAALLLRGGILAGKEIRSEVRDSGVLGAAYEGAQMIVEGLGAFEEPSYLIRTCLNDQNQLESTGVYFFSGGDGCVPHSIFDSRNSLSIDEAFDLIVDHMDKFGVRSESIINMVVPITVLLNPPPSIQRIEEEYPIVFRERHRAECLEKYRRLRPKLRDKLNEVKGKVARKFTSKWFEAADESGWETVELPAVRIGNMPDALACLETLLGSLIPFAVVTRTTMPTVTFPEEAMLAGTVHSAVRFAHIPIAIHNERGKQSLFRHITVIWDDRDLRGYSH